MQMTPLDFVKVLIDPFYTIFQNGGLDTNLLQSTVFLLVIAGVVVLLYKTFMNWR